MSPTIRRIANILRAEPLARGAAQMLAGQLARTGIQGMYFVLLARTLAPSGYGEFIGVLALASIVAPFASLGGGNLLIKNVAHDPARSGSALGNAWFLVAASGCLLLALLAAVAHRALPPQTPIALVLAIGAAELVFARFLDVCGAAFQAHQKLGRTSLLPLSLSVARLAGIAVVGLSAHAPTPLTWGVGYLVATVVAAMFGLYLALIELPAPTLDLPRLRAQLIEGSYFAVSLSAQSLYNDLDKTMLTRLVGFAAAGIYGAAYRMVDVSFLPIRSLLFASYSRFFQHGRQGLTGTIAFARKLVPLALAYAGATMLVLIAAAPLVPFVLGERFAEVVPALRWLSPILVLRAVHYFAADALTGAGHQGLRSVVQLIVAGINVVLNLWLIPAYGWRGGAWASLACDGLLLALLGAAVLVLQSAEQKHGH